MRNQQQNKFAAITLSAALVIMAAATLPSTVVTYAQETTTQYCFNEENADGVVIGFTCFDSRKDCNDFRNDIRKQNNPEETGIAKFTACKAEQQSVNGTGLTS